MLEICINCQKKFKIKPFHKKRFKGPFCCSRSCRGQFLKIAYKGSSNPNVRYFSELDKLLTIRCNDIERRSKKQNIQFDLTAEFLKDLYLKQNGLCFYTGIPMKLTSSNFLIKGQTDLDTMSVDRIIPKNGYIKSNVALCCSAINKLKGNSNPSELQEFLSALGLKTFGTCKLKFKKLRSNAEAPFRAQLGDGGYDLSAALIEDLGNQIKVYTGLAFQADPGWVLLAIPRSSIVKKGIRLSNSVGLIDNQYRGEVIAVFDKLETYESIQEGERIIQLVPLRTPFLNIEEVKELDVSDRGSNGFGSSGV